MELLLGCGNNRRKRVTFPGVPETWAELVTLDVDPGVNPHVVHDLNDINLPFDENQFHEIHAYEVLEHCGRQGDWRFFLDQFSEFHRILKPGGWFIATVPAWDSEWAWGDPGHCRVITPGSLMFLSQQDYENQVGKTAMTDYRGWYKADFEIYHAQIEGAQFCFILRAKK